MKKLARILKRISLLEDRVDELEEFNTLPYSWSDDSWLDDLSEPARDFLYPRKIWGESNDIGARVYLPLLDLIGDKKGFPIEYICVEGQPEADDPLSEEQRQRNIDNWHRASTLGYLGNFDQNEDGVHDRIAADPTSIRTYPGDWPTLKAYWWNPKTAHDLVYRTSLSTPPGGEPNAEDREEIRVVLSPEAIMANARILVEHL